MNSLIYTLIFAPVVLAIGYSLYIITWLKRQLAGNEKMREISLAIQEGSNAYLNRQSKSVGIVAVILFIIISILIGKTAAIGFLIGGALPFLFLKIYILIPNAGPDKG